MFLYKYKYLYVNDIECFFESKYYYKRQISKLIQDSWLRKIDNNYFVLGRNGINYLRNMGYEFKKIRYEKQFVARLKNISNIAASFYNNKNIEFKSGTEVKDKTIYTICSRRYFGICSIQRKEYLTYYISKDHEDKYIRSILFDIQKEKKNKNIIIFAEDISKISINDYKFGLNEILIIPYTNKNKTLLSKIMLIDWYKILCMLYPNEKIIISKYDLIEYVTDNNKYINYFAFVDSEKIDSCKRFLQHNPNKQIDITNDELLKLYFEARSDYRNALNLEQTVLNFGVAILAVCTATGFVYYGAIQSWIVFSLIIPFFLTLVKGLYLHQKHRSKTYKAYQIYLETSIRKRVRNFHAFESWKSNAVTKFISKRRGFYFLYFSTCVLVPYLFMALGLLSYQQTSISLCRIFYGVSAIVLTGDLVCIRYVISIMKISK